MTLTRIYRFSASHRLHSPELPDAENARLYGKCNNAFGHGHDYVLEVTAIGIPDQITGVILPVPKLDQLVKNQVLDLFAFRNINIDISAFRNLVPTTENVAIVIRNLIVQHWPSYLKNTGARLHRVLVRETDRNSFEVLASLESGAKGELRENERATVNA